MRTQTKKAFTIIELLVVVSIIALLIGILLPAIGKARDRAHQTRSMSNLRQLGQAHAIYGAEWNDNQWTTGPHNLATFAPNANSLNALVTGFKAAYGGSPKSVVFENNQAAVRLGFAFHKTGGQGEYFWFDKAHGTHNAIVPMGLEASETRLFGFYRMINAKPFNVYMGGRVYDSSFFAPKDRVPIQAIGVCWDAPGEYCELAGGKYGTISSSYVLSPAALYNPDLFGSEFSAKQLYTTPAAYRTPSFGQVRYADLKTHMIEHHWLQRPRRDCNPSASGFLAEYNNCAPYFFNASRDSMPATLFYDGHVEMLSVREAIQANMQAVTSGGDDEFSLWNNKTPLGGHWTAKAGGYYSKYAYTPPGGGGGGQQFSSFHILTRHGVFGRDTFSR